MAYSKQEYNKLYYQKNKERLKQKAAERRALKQKNNDKIDEVIEVKPIIKEDKPIVVYDSEKETKTKNLYLSYVQKQPKIVQKFIMDNINRFEIILETHDNRYISQRIIYQSKNTAILITLRTCCVLISKESKIDKDLRGIFFMKTNILFHSNPSGFVDFILPLMRGDIPKNLSKYNIYEVFCGMFYTTNNNKCSCKICYNETKLKYKCYRCNVAICSECLLNSLRNIDVIPKCNFCNYDYKEHMKKVDNL